MSLNVLDATVGELRAGLLEGRLTSEHIVSEYFSQIERHNINGLGVRALISTAPRESVLTQARALDAERKEKGPRGPFHGIPILIKDTFLTKASMGMATTFGSAALIDAMATENAAVVDLILDAGMIVLGKTSISEFNNYKATPPNTGGWSSAGNQGQSPYVVGGVSANATFLGHSTPCGSSSGSAIGVAAGFAPIALGAETDGSIVQPCSRAGLYALKPTPGTVSVANVLAGPTFDAVGPMARTAKDVADMVGLLMGEDFTGALKGSWQGIKVGIVQYEPWAPAPFVVEPVDEFTAQVKDGMRQAVEKIRKMGGTVAEDVTLSPFWEYADFMTSRGIDADSFWGDYSHSRYGLRDVFDALMTKFETAKVRTLAEMIQYHRTHADTCLPPGHSSQAGLESILEEKVNPKFEEIIKEMREEARARIDGALDKFGVDVILSQSDGRMASLAAAAGYAVSALPLGYADFNGRAWGVNAVAGARGEAKMLELMSVWEATFPDARQSPPQLRETSNPAL
ncbi:amidase, putative [Cordyceps militaris CM01]|uniref:Amidase, putative n=1 Tax=Cordyceps militaris (strain CM01) TaxID=983644 RepID=G3JSM9_CORMM|nr:amidase, putative [Cordyceps militaris CM01]EGX88875.1 amidase, putative [Cordyceps militaris CM01]